MKKLRLEVEFGYTDYHYEMNDRNPNGLLVIQGSYVDVEARSGGTFKKMIKKIFSSYPSGTVVELAVMNPHLDIFFKRLGFNEIPTLQYYNNSDNIRKYSGVLSEQLMSII